MTLARARHPVRVGVVPLTREPPLGDTVEDPGPRGVVDGERRTLGAAAGGVRVRRVQLPPGVSEPDAAALQAYVDVRGTAQPHERPASKHEGVGVASAEHQAQVAPARGRGEPVPPARRDRVVGDLVPALVAGDPDVPLRSVGAVRLSEPVGDSRDHLVGVGAERLAADPGAGHRERAGDRRLAVAATPGFLGLEPVAPAQQRHGRDQRDETRVLFIRRLLSSTGGDARRAPGVALG